MSVNADQTPAGEPTEQTSVEQQLGARARARAATESDGIRLTELAARQVREYMSKAENPESNYLFVGVKGGGCSGLTYVLDLRDENSAPVAETDEVFESHKVIIVCDLKSYMVGNMAGTEVDFQDGMTGRGFTFNNPNAKQQCGCGSSYSA